MFSFSSNFFSNFLSDLAPTVDLKDIGSKIKAGELFFENLEIDPKSFIKNEIPINIIKCIIKSMKIYKTTDGDKTWSLDISNISMLCSLKDKRFYSLKKNTKEQIRILNFLKKGICHSLINLIELKINIKNIQIIIICNAQNQIDNDTISDKFYRCYLGMDLNDIFLLPLEREFKSGNYYQFNISRFSLFYKNQLEFNIQQKIKNLPDFIDEFNNFFNSDSPKNKKILLINNTKILATLKFDQDHKLISFDIKSDDIEMFLSRNEIKLFFEIFLNKNNINYKSNIENLFQYIKQKASRNELNIENALTFLRNRQMYFNSFIIEDNVTKTNIKEFDLSFNNDVTNSLLYYCSYKIKQTLDKNKMILNDFVLFDFFIPNVKIHINRNYQDQKNEHYILLKDVKFKNYTGNIQENENLEFVFNVSEIESSKRFRAKNVNSVVYRTNFESGSLNDPGVKIQSSIESLYYPFENNIDDMIGQFFDEIYFPKLNQCITIKEVTLDLIFIERISSIVMENARLDVQNKRISLSLSNINILPNNSLMKICNCDENIMTITLEKDKTGQFFSIELFINDCELNIDYPMMFQFFNFFRKPSSSLKSLFTEQVKAKFSILTVKTKPIKIIDNSIIGIPLVTIISLSYSSSLIPNKISDILNINIDIASMYFVKDKPITRDVVISYNINQQKNLLIKISKTQLYISPLEIKYFLKTFSEIKNYKQKLPLSFDSPIIFSILSIVVSLIELKSISVDFGEISIIFCQSPYHPSLRLIIPSISTSILNEEETEFHIHTYLNFFNEKICDWDYIIEPFIIYFNTKMSISENDVYLKIKSCIGNEDGESLNINIPLEFFYSLIQTDPSSIDKFEDFPLFFVKNNMDRDIFVKMKFKSDNIIYSGSLGNDQALSSFALSPNQSIPIIQNDYPSTFEITFENKVYEFSPSYLTYPLMFSSNLCIVKNDKIIEIGSPFQIENCLNGIPIYLFEKGKNEFNLKTTLYNNTKYPLFFTSDKPKQYLFVIDKENNKKYEITLLSPADTKTEQISLNHKYHIIKMVVNNAGGKIIKLIPPVIIENLLPYVVFLKIYKHEDIPYFIEKNSLSDCIILDSTTSKFKAALSMNGSDFSNINSCSVDITKPLSVSPSKKLIISEIPAMYGATTDPIPSTPFGLPLSYLARTTLKIHDCRFQNIVDINVKFEKLNNGQLKIILFAPFAFYNMCNMELMILNGNSNHISLPTFGWSSLTYKEEGVIFKSIEEEIAITAKGYEKQNILYKDLNDGQYSIYLKELSSDDSDKGSNIDDINAIYLPLRMIFKRQNNGICSISFSELISIKNDLDLQVNLDYITLQPHSNSKISKINGKKTICFSIGQSILKKTISLDSQEFHPSIRDDNYKCNEFEKLHFIVAILIEDINRTVEVEISNSEFDILICFRKIILHTPVVLTNKFSDRVLVAYHNNRGNATSVPAMSTSNFFFDDLFNQNEICVQFEQVGKENNEIYKLSLSNTTGPIEISNDFSVSVKEISPLFKCVIFSPIIRTETKNKVYSHEYPWLKISFELDIINLFISLFESKLKEVREAFISKMTLKVNKIISSIETDEETNIDFSIKSIVLNDQSPWIKKPKIFCVADPYLEKPFVSITQFMSNSYKFMKIKIKDSKLRVNKFSVSIIKSIINYLKEKSLLSNYEWVEISPLSFTLYLSDNAGIYSFPKHERINISFPGLVFGQFNRNFFEEIINEYQNLIIPQLSKNSNFSYLKATSLNQINNQFCDESLCNNKNNTVSEFNNKSTIFNYINRSSLLLLALLFAKKGIKPTNIMAELIGGKPNIITIFKCNNGFKCRYEREKNINDAVVVPRARNSFKTLYDGIQIDKFRKASFNEQVHKVNIDLRRRNSSIHDFYLDVASAEESNETISTQDEYQQKKRMPRCIIKNQISIYNEQYAQLSLLIQKKYHQEKIRLLDKCMVTNSIICLTDRFIILVNPSMEYITNEISFLNIATMNVQQGEIRIVGKKYQEKLSFRFENEETANEFNIFIASQRYSLGMFGVSLIEK